MSDEWIAGRALRSGGTVLGQGALDDPVPRYTTADGRLAPLTDEAIAEIEALVDAHARGETPPGFTPEIEMPGGHREPITRRALDDLVAAAQRARQLRAREPVMDEPPGWRTDVGLPPVTTRRSSRPAALDYVPWFETNPGSLPPVEDESGMDVHFDEPDKADEDGDLVDAEWIVEVPVTAPSRGQPDSEWRPIGPVTRQLLATVREGRLTGGFEKVSPYYQWLRYIPLAAAIALLVAVTILLKPFGFLSSIVEQDAVPEPTGEPSVTALPATATAEPFASPAQVQVPALNYGRIVFSSNRDGDFEIYSLDLAAGTITQITSNAYDDRSPAWSPDGTRIVYVSNRSGTDDLYLTEASGANQVRLTTSDDEDRFPAWSADGAHIIFSRENVNGAELVSFQTDCMAEPGACESFLQTITFNRYDLYPEWLPGDTGLVFSTSDYPGLPSAIGLFDIATSTAIALDGTGSTDFDPALSPDGGWIAFVSNARSSHDIWAMRLDGTGLTRVILNVSTDIQPAWSHRGDFLVFASDRGSEGGFDLYLIAAACILGNYVGCEDNLIRITSDTADDLDPDWTP